MLVVGLGNPGPRYAASRHNAGALVVERLAERRGVALDEHRFEGRFGQGRVGTTSVALLLPETFMNRSGEAVGDAVEGLPLADPPRDLLVVYDDLDLPFGRLRLRPSGGSGGHRGMADVMVHLAALGVAEEGRGFPRLRVGIGRPPPGADPVAWVLAPFGPDERARLPGVLDAGAAAVEAVLREGVEAAMNRVNRPPAEPAAPEDPAAG